MQVKKFEAKSMKEALEMVKTHLGPEAIILSAKDTHRGFGLMGEKSVEVTAAVTEETLRKKKLAESKLRDDLREKFNQIPATKQKEFINRVYNQRYDERREPAMAGAGGGMESIRARAQAAAGPALPAQVRAELKGIRYADIVDEDQQNDGRGRGRERVRRAAEAARMASKDVFQENKPRRQAAAVPSTAAPNQELRALESQVRELKNLVEKFQKMPQVPLSAHPGAEQGLPMELGPLYQRLCAQGIEASTVAGWLKKAANEMDAANLKKPALIDAWAVRHLLHDVFVSPNPLQGRYQVFIGSAGQGKTSSLIKMASHLVLKERKTIAIIGLDTMKLGATEQLRIFAQILNVPFAVVRSPEEWRVAEQKLQKVQHILVDAPGFSLKSMNEAEWLKRMLPPVDFNRTLHYVQAAVARDEESLDIASRYQMIGFHDVIFTRIDECTRHGLLINFQKAFDVPIHSFGTGIRIPEDFEIASKERIVDLIFKLRSPA